jgi:hypothetical protein
MHIAIPGGLNGHRRISLSENPPFVAGTNFRAIFGDEYAEALWAVYPAVPGGADYVMFWWEAAAERLKPNNSVLKRFGLVTTNSITQQFAAKVVRRHLDDGNPISIVVAIPNHPWIKNTAGAAAVRIAMTVCERGRAVYGRPHSKKRRPSPLYQVLTGEVNRLRPSLM